MGNSSQDRQAVAMERIAVALERMADAHLNPDAKKVKTEHLNDYNLLSPMEKSEYDHDPRHYAMEREAEEAHAAKVKAAQVKADQEAAKAKAAEAQQHPPAAVAPAPMPSQGPVSRG